MVWWVSVCGGTAEGREKEGLCRADVINATGRPSPFIPLWITPTTVTTFATPSRTYRPFVAYTYSILYYTYTYYTILVLGITCRVYT